MEREEIIALLKCTSSYPASPEDINLKTIQGNGLHARYLDDVFGRKAGQNITKGTPLSWDIII